MNLFSFVRKQIYLFIFLQTETMERSKHNTRFTERLNRVKLDVMVIVAQC